MGLVPRRDRSFLRSVCLFRTSGYLNWISDRGFRGLLRKFEGERAVLLIPGEARIPSNSNKTLTLWYSSALDSTFLGSSIRRFRLAVFGFLYRTFRSFSRTLSDFIFWITFNLFNFCTRTFFRYRLSTLACRTPLDRTVFLLASLLSLPRHQIFTRRQPPSAPASENSSPKPSPGCPPSSSPWAVPKPTKMP